MRINAEFDKRVVVHGGSSDWIASPLAGVDRVMLDRLGDEVARATSLVRYAPGSHFSPHVHTGGEEFLVLEGVFQDEHGDYETGCYVRNPPTTSHTPRSDAGCVIFVKLWQFDMDDRQSVCVRPTSEKMAQDDSVDGVSAQRLFKDDNETVELQDWQAGAQVDLDAEGGMEVLVLAGGFVEGQDELSKWSWLRLPVGGRGIADVGKNGAKVWIKCGHLTGGIKAPV